MAHRPKLYCGNGNVVPDGYDRAGSRFECLRKGYGSALVYSTEASRKQAIQSMIMNAPANMTVDQLSLVGRNMGVSPYNQNGTRRTKNQLINAMIARLVNME
jgi:hypothetical protein